METKYIYYIIGGSLIVLLILYLCLIKKANPFIVAITSTKRIQKNLYEHCKINDFLCLSNVPFPINDYVNKYKYIDTIIIGNKYIYIIKEIKNLGEIVYKEDDATWRVIYDRKLRFMDNPLFRQRKIVEILSNKINDLTTDDFKTMVIFTSTCSLNGKTSNPNEIVLLEEDAFKTILEIEKNSDKKSFSDDDQEKIAKIIYRIGRDSEKTIKYARRK